MHNLSLQLSEIVRYDYEHLQRAYLVSQKIEPGEICLLTGNNGSGKSTLLKIIAGIIRLPSELGKILLNLQEQQNQSTTYRKCIYFLGHQHSLSLQLSVTQNLRYLLNLYDNHANQSNISNLLGRWRLDRLAHNKLGTLSNGERKIVALAALCASDRPIWLLDEPFAGLDDTACAILTEHLQAHQTTGGISLISSHQSLSIPYTHHITI